MRVLIKKASDLDFHREMVFDDWGELGEFMQSQFGTWIVSFKRSSSEYYDVVVMMYDDYIEFGGGE